MPASDLDAIKARLAEYDKAYRIARAGITGSDHYVFQDALERVADYQRRMDADLRAVLDALGAARAENAVLDAALREVLSDDQAGLFRIDHRCVACGRLAPDHNEACSLMVARRALALAAQDTSTGDDDANATQARIAALEAALQTIVGYGERHGIGPGVFDASYTLDTVAQIARRALDAQDTSTGDDNGKPT